MNFDDDCFLVFVDETGHELFADKSHPVFGLGGCAVLASHYEVHVKRPWEHLRNTYFGSVKGPLHAAELRRLTEAQLVALVQFFASQPFRRIASVLSDRAALADDLKPYQIAARSLLERIAQVAPAKLNSVALIIEESERTDRMAHAFFSGYSIAIDTPDGRATLPIRGYKMPKASREPGLEIADFVMHAVGGEARQRRGVQVVHGPLRKDFAAVFESVDPRLVSFMEIQRAE